MARKPTYSSNWTSGSENAWTTRLSISNSRSLVELISHSMSFNLLQVAFKLSGKSYPRISQRTLRLLWVIFMTRGHWRAERSTWASRKRKKRLKSSTISLLALAEVPLIVSTTRMDINKSLQSRKMRHLATYPFLKTKETPPFIWTKKRLRQQQVCHQVLHFLTFHPDSAKEKWQELTINRQCRKVCVSHLSICILAIHWYQMINNSKVLLQRQRRWSNQPVQINLWWDLS